VQRLIAGVSARQIGHRVTASAAKRTIVAGHGLAVVSGEVQRRTPFKVRPTSVCIMRINFSAFFS
jgi:hypothetical protein